MTENELKKIKSPAANDVVSSLFEDREAFFKSLDPMKELRRHFDLDPFKGLREQASKTFAQYEEPMKRLREQFSEALRPMEELRKQFSLAMEPYEKIRQEIRKSMEGFKIPDLFPKRFLINTSLFRGFWIIRNEELIDELEEQQIVERKAIAKYVIDFYSSNNYSKFTKLADKWNSSGVKQTRIEIITDCFEIVKSYKAEKANIFNVVIPTLIAQIDGLMSDIYLLIPKKVKKDIEKYIKDEVKTELKESAEEEIKDHEIMVYSLERMINTNSAMVVHTMVIEGLFRNSNSIKKAKKQDSRDLEDFDLFRHKIMHGDREFLSYGKKEHFIRLFLYTDFLINLISKMKSQNK